VRALDRFVCGQPGMDGQTTRTRDSQTLQPILSCSSQRPCSLASIEKTADRFRRRLNFALYASSSSRFFCCSGVHSIKYMPNSILLRAFIQSSPETIGFALRSRAQLRPACTHVAPRAHGNAIRYHEINELRDRPLLRSWSIVRGRIISAMCSIIWNCCGLKKQRLVGAGRSLRRRCDTFSCT